MRSTKRAACKLEGRVQALSHLKTKGTADERGAARRKLADGLSGRYQKGERVDARLVQTMHNLRSTGYATV